MIIIPYRRFLEMSEASYERNGLTEQLHRMYKPKRTDTVLKITV